MSEIKLSQLELQVFCVIATCLSSETVQNTKRTLWNFTDAVDEAVETLAKQGLVESQPGGQFYSATEKGENLLRELLSYDDLFNELKGAKVTYSERTRAWRAAETARHAAGCTHRNIARNVSRRILSEAAV